MYCFCYYLRYVMGCCQTNSIFDQILFALFQDLFHNPPSYKSMITPSWKAPVSITSLLSYDAKAWLSPINISQCHRHEKWSCSHVTKAYFSANCVVAVDSAPSSSSSLIIIINHSSLIINHYHHTIIIYLSYI